MKIDPVKIIIFSSFVLAMIIVALLVLRARLNRSDDTQNNPPNIITVPGAVSPTIGKYPTPSVVPLTIFLNREPPEFTGYKPDVFTDVEQEALDRQAALFDLIPIVEPDFTLDYDYAVVAYKVTLHTPEASSRVKFTSWMKDNDFDILLDQRDFNYTVE